VTPHEEYVAHGWVLVPIASGKKGPTRKGWNARERCVVPPAWQGNIGLAHGYSGTCAIDIDDLEMATDWLAKQGVDLTALLADPAAVMISSGRPNRAKLLYRIASPIESKKYVEKIDDKPHSIIDFRCGNAKGSTVQDVLPPSVHPDTGKPYEWAYANELVGDWRNLPVIPAPLLNIWCGLIATSEIGPLAPEGSSDNEVTLETLRELLLAHDPDIDRDSWVRNMAAVHHETRGSAEGLELAIEWSSRGTKYKGRQDVERVWRSFHDSGARLITAASLRIDTPATDDDFDVITLPEPDIKADIATVSGPLPKLDFDTDEDGYIYANRENLRLALGRADYCGTRIVLDTFRDDVMLGRNATDELRSLKDTDYERLGIWLEFNHFKPIPHESLRRSVALVADDNQIDSAQLWLESLTWDGVPRIERFLADYFSAGDTPYTRAVSLYWWTAHAGGSWSRAARLTWFPYW
jgi:hypothetical protein